MATVTVLLVDDHTLIRDLLETRLQGEGSIQVVGSTGDTAEAIRLAEQHHPDVAVMDIEIPGQSSFAAARQMTLSLPGLRLIFLTAYPHDHYIEEALRLGALGFLTKGESASRIAQAILEVMSDRSVFSDEVRARIVVDGDGARLTPRRTLTSLLTTREREVLFCIAQGHSKKEIAHLLQVGVKTVDKHTENLMRKLEIHDRVELARYAFREGIARP